MKYKKKEIKEIVDGNENLIGSDDMPSVDMNADTQAKNTTDYNAKVGTQPYRYDMLGRFGFTLMPFMEGEEKNEGQKDLLNDLTKLMHERFIDILKYYYKNPNKLKPNYRKLTAGEYSEEFKKNDNKWAHKAIDIFSEHIDKSLKNLDEQFKENIAETKFIEEKLVNKKEDKLTKKDDDKEIREKKLKKIAGLINRLEKKDIDNLINLLERKDEKN